MTQANRHMLMACVVEPGFRWVRGTRQNPGKLGQLQVQINSLNIWLTRQGASAMHCLVDVPLSGRAPEHHKNPIDVIRTAKPLVAVQLRADVSDIERAGGAIYDNRPPI